MDSFRKTGVMSLIQTVWDYIITHIVPRFIEFMFAPIRNPDMIYILLPLLASLTMMEMYFGRNKTEELGWNTAFGNTVSLFFVIAGLGKYLLEKYSIDDLISGATPTYKLIFVGFLLLQAWVLIRFNYFHSLSARIAFIISSSLPVNVTALLAIIIVMGDMSFDLVTLGAAVFTFVVFWVFYTLLQICIEPSIGAKAVITRRKHEREALWHHRINQMKSRVNAFKDKMLSHFQARQDLSSKLPKHS